MGQIRLFHGSEQIVRKPFLGGGSSDNDYGFGFYCTKDIELAREWACLDQNSIGYCNEYILDDKDLNVFHLDEDNILAWMALLVKNRDIRISSKTALQARKWLIDNYLPCLDDVDLIVGYRADDSYFRYARGFLNGQIGIKTLSEAVRLGKLGKQYVCKSVKAFDQLEFVKAEVVDNKIYFSKRIKREESARLEYEILMEDSKEGYKDKIDYLIEGGIKTNG